MHVKASFAACALPESPAPLVEAEGTVKGGGRAFLDNPSGVAGHMVVTRAALRPGADLLCNGLQH
eukprot:2142926-Prorocentrum_lima.AAC.1